MVRRTRWPSSVSQLKVSSRVLSSRSTTMSMAVSRSICSKSVAYGLR